MSRGAGPPRVRPPSPPQDIFQARYGAHGDYEVIALTPWSVQEMFDLTVRAFNLAESYRTPVMLMADGEIGHINEKIMIPEDVEIVDRRRPSEKDCTPFGTDDRIEPPKIAPRQRESNPRSLPTARSVCAPPSWRANGTAERRA